MRYKIFNKHDEDLGKISKNMKFQEQITVKNIDHLGLVAGLIDDLGIVEHINQLVGEQPGEIVNPGLAVKAMIINGLGLVSAPLYLFSKFFEGSASNYPIPPVPISITYGYSQGPSPDLPQFIVQLICSGDGDVPLFLKVASGNESDSAVFASIIIQQLVSQLSETDFVDAAVTGYRSSEHRSNYGGVSSAMASGRKFVTS